MIHITPEFKASAVSALMEARNNFSGTDKQFSTQYGINNAVFSRLKGGETEGLLRDAQWLEIGRMLDLTRATRKMNIVRTEVFNLIEEDILFCQSHSKSMMFVDECEIGKTETARYLSRTLKNCFYIDASQAKTKQAFIRLMAKTIGLDDAGKYLKVKASIKYALKNLPNPIVIIDEAGDLEYTAFLELKEFWNATENACGWYMMGADGLRDKMERGINNKKVGFAEIFSRFSSKFSRIVPNDKQEKRAFYHTLITSVISANIEDKSLTGELVKRCMVTDENGKIGGLRRAESLLIIHS